MGRSPRDSVIKDSEHKNYLSGTSSKQHKSIVSSVTSDKGIMYIYLVRQKKWYELLR